MIAHVRFFSTSSVLFKDRGSIERIAINGKQQQIEANLFGRLENKC